MSFLRLRAAGEGARPASRLAEHDGLAPLAAATAAGTVLSALGPLVVAFGVDHGAVPGKPGWVLAAVALLAAIAGLNMKVTAVDARLNARYTHGFLTRVRHRLLRHLYALDLDHFEKERRGRVVSRFTADLQAIQQFLEAGVPLMIRACLSISVTTGLMVSRSPRLTGIVLGTTVPLVAATVVYRRHVLGTEMEVRDRVARLLTHLNESLIGIQVVQAYSVEDHRREGFREANGATYDARMRTARATTAYYPLVEFVPALAFAVVLAVGGNMAARGEITVGTVLAFTLFLNHLFTPIQQLTEVAPLLLAARAARSKVAEFLASAPRVVDGGTRSLPGDGCPDVAVEGVTFRYGDRAAPALAAVDLVVPAGQRVALLGESGAGKSTLAKLVARLYDPQEGRVTVGGVDVREVPLVELRRSVALVPQEGYLFDGTVADNVAVARPGVTRAEVEAVCERLGVISALATHPGGLDAPVFAGGSSLSAGQHQLVALARVAVADPRVLVLDEPTSNLDPASELRLESALRGLFEGRTVIVIAHRLGTALRSDRIVMLHRGAVVDDGAPDELLRTDGPFARWAAGGGEGGPVAATKQS